MKPSAEMVEAGARAADPKLWAAIDERTDNAGREYSVASVRKNSLARAEVVIRAALAVQPAPVQGEWKMVPVEPTEEMLDAGCECDAYDIAVGSNKRTHEDLMAKYPGALKPRETHGAAPMQTLPIIWAAMLAASPTPPDGLREWVGYVVNKFQKDEDQGYRSKDRQFALDVLKKGLATTAPSPAQMREALNKLEPELSEGARKALTTGYGVLLESEEIFNLGWRMAITAAKEALSLVPQPAGDGWRTMDSAPKDGTKIEVKYISDDPRPVRWGTSDHGTWWHLTDVHRSAIIKFDPTHWRPLPNPPTMEGGG